MLGVELTPDLPVAAVADLAAAAESAGFDAALVSCHYNNRDPFVAADRAAAATDDVLVGPAAANPYDAHPVALASRAATLQEVSGGRAVLGLGAGDRSTLRNLGVDRERPLRRVLETMRGARRLWAGERLTHDGTFRARDAGLNYEVPASVVARDGDAHRAAGWPVGRLPVYVGAQGPGMLRMAGKHADGVLVNAAHPRDVAWATERVAEGVADRPEGWPGPDVAAFASVSVAEDGEAARAAARYPVAFVVAGAPPDALARHDLDGARAARVGDRVAAGEFGDAADLVTGPMLDAFCVAGTPEAVRERIESLATRADSLVLGSPLGPDRREAVRLLAAATGR